MNMQGYKESVLSKTTNENDLPFEKEMRYFFVNNAMHFSLLF